MADVRDLLRRQASWQRSRKDLPWPVKIRMAEQARDAALRLRASRSGERAGPGADTVIRSPEKDLGLP
jgi:hypothetical protein